MRTLFCLFAMTAMVSCRQNSDSGSSDQNRDGGQKKSETCLFYGLYSTHPIHHLEPHFSTNIVQCHQNVTDCDLLATKSPAELNYDFGPQTDCPTTGPIGICQNESDIIFYETEKADESILEKICEKYSGTFVGY